MAILSPPFLFICITNANLDNPRYKRGPSGLPEFIEGTTKVFSLLFISLITAAIGHLNPIKARCRYFIGKSGSGTALTQKLLKLISKKIAVLKMINLFEKYASTYAN